MLMFADNRDAGPGRGRTPVALLILFVVAGVLPAGASAGEPWRDLPGLDLWPKSIRYVGSPDGGRAFVISGIYRGNTSLWTEPGRGNAVMRQLKIFAAADSLFVDAAAGEAWFFTQSDPEEFSGRFEKIAIYSGCLPTLDELYARDLERAETDGGFLAELGRCDLDKQGRLLPVDAGGGCGGLHVSLLGPSRAPLVSNDTREFLISLDAGGLAEVTACPGDTIAYGLFRAVSSYRAADFAVARFADGAVAVAKLNETHEHCKGHMAFALRLYDEQGRSFWKAEDGLFGAIGVWARDLDCDGNDEILVLADDHGTRRWVVFGKPVANGR